MAVNAKAVKQRIKSAKNTKKITNAMELVSAAKMRKAVEAAENTRLYATLARELLHRLAFLDEPNYPLLELRPVKKVLVVVMSSNRGLCGGFNANVFKHTKAVLENTKRLGEHRVAENRDVPEFTTDIEIDILGVGKKSAWFAKKHGYNLPAVFDDLHEKPQIEDILSVSDMAIRGYIDKTYDKVLVSYTHYISGLSQEVKVRQVLPVSPHDLEKMGNELPSGKGESLTADTAEIERYLFEPDLETIIETILPKLVEVQLYQAILESTASEHSSRMVAMKNASDNAGDLIEDLTREYNKARQAAITQEIAEIAGGAAALS